MKYQPVERRQDLSYDQFVQEYGGPEKPVIVTDLTRDWPAQTGWTFDFFRQRYGHLTVQVKREAQRTLAMATRSMTMAQYIDYLETTRDESPYYLASWDFMLDAPELAQDYSLPGYWQDDWLLDVSPELRPRLLWLFIGPARTGFRMHVDVGHTAAWNVQLVGSKKWTLFAADQLPHLYFGRVNSFDPDLKLHPNFVHAQGYECVLHPGEAIFVPSAWWHQTQILENSLAISGNYANQHNIRHVLAWLQEREEHAALAEELRRRALLDSLPGPAGPPSRP
jgi:hypothetical protein